MDILEKLKDFFADEPATIQWDDKWITYLKGNLPIYNQLPEELRERLHEKMGQFIATTFFEGCGGLELTDEMILTVSAQACILVLGYEGAPYPDLDSILLYPAAFETSSQSVGPGGTVIERKVKALGESWDSGTVVLSWNSVRNGAANMFDGHNVTFHEFAHQLDSMDGDTDGVPLLQSEEAYQTWANVLGEHCSDLIDKVQRGRKTVIDSYGATSPGEFFAVASETFFEKPRQLKKKRPELYEELKGFYNLDPESWF